MRDFATLSICMLPALLTGAEAVAMQVSPHRALYELRMIETRASNSISNVRGRMLYEWSEACDAWITDQKLTMNYAYTEGGQLRFDSHFSSWETKRGDEYSFTVKRLRNGDVAEEFRGSAEIDPADGTGEAIYSIPGDLALELPAGAVFPTRHIFEIMDRALAGERFFNSVMFDGSDEAGMMEVNAFIGPPLPIEADAGLDAAELIAGPARNVRLAFFELGDQTSDPAYEMTLQLHENGVVSRMRIDYDEFTLDGALGALERLPETGCE